MEISFIMMRNVNDNVRVNAIRIYLGVRMLFGQCSKHPFEGPEYMEACRRNLHNYLYDGVNYARNHRAACEVPRVQHDSAYAPQRVLSPQAV
jgi:hypothetical protein